MAMQMILPSAGALTCMANLPLIASMNPCPCDYYSDPVKECTCFITTVKHYSERISGPLMDRIGIHVEVPRVSFEKLSARAYHRILKLARTMWG